MATMLDVMPAAEAPPVSWSARLAPFRHPDLARSIWQLSSTTVLFVAGWLLMYASLRLSYWVTLLLAVPTGFMVIRLFIIQHDCGHGSFFKSTRAADAVGRVLGVLTMTPYSYWKRTHAMHHATSGNLDHRGFGDITTLTVREYLAKTPVQRLKYRLYRHPLILFVIGPSFHFMLVHRVPGIVPREWRRERRSILGTNVSLAAGVIGMGLLVGFKAFLLVHLPLMAMTASLGVWLFYVQHQFEPTYWEHDEGWSYDAAALEGSSHYELPRVLRWLTGNIGLHHVHHLNSRIPNYRLQRVLDDVPELQTATRITLWQSLRCASLALWDERTRTLVPFP
jgi:acyl-lipid omega-6 desaturase (Delta-12 desaturase)